MRVVDTTLFYAQSSGGVHTYVDSKRRGLLARDMEHKVVYPGAEPVLQGDFIQLPALNLPMAPGFRFPTRVGLWSHIVAGLQPDLIEAGDPYTPAWAARRAARMLDVPAVAFYHSDLITLLHNRISPMLDGATRAYLRKLYDGFNLVLSPSRVMAERLWDCGLHNVEIQPLGVDVRVFHPNRADPLARARLGLGEHERLLVFAGRGSQEKHLPVLFDALRQLGSGYHLLLIGTGPQPDAPGNTTVFEDFLPAAEVAAWLASSDALLHAGDQETFGLVALEAMASAIPVICADGGALPEVVPEGCGLRVPPHDGVAMAAAVRALFEEHDPVAMGERARRHVEAEHGWDKVVDSLVRHYRRLIGARPETRISEHHGPQT